MSDVRIEVDLAYPAELVWRAISERQLLSDWFMPTDLLPVEGRVYRAFPPAGLTGFSSTFEIDVLEVVGGQRLRTLWRGERMHSEVVWELTGRAGGCRLTLTQSGFLGLSGQQRREELGEAYELLFHQRLPALLAILGEPVREKGSLPRAAAAKRQRWRWFNKIPVERRLPILSVIGAMVLTVLAATATAVIVLRPPVPPEQFEPDDSLPGQAAQAGVQPATSAKPSAAPHPGQPSPSTTAGAQSPAAARSDVPGLNERTELTAAYRTAERYQLGYIGSITITAGGLRITGWTAVIELPKDAKVTSAWDQVGFRQEGRRIVFTPGETHRELAAGGTFTFSFQVSDATETGRPLACVVNDLECVMLGS